MIVTRRFVFLHLHKSGGTFVNEWLMKYFADARQIGYHLPRRLLPAEFAALPVIGLVRNPWSYYVSWHAFQSRRPRPNALFQGLSDGGRLDFEGTIRNMLELGAGSARLDAIVAALPKSFTNHGLNLPGRELAAIRGSGVGFYTFLYRYMYSGEGPLHVGTMERMREQLPELLRAAGETIGNDAAAYLSAAAPVNRSEHKPYPDYYGPELRDLVAERDRELIGRYGYRFGE